MTQYPISFDILLSAWNERDPVKLREKVAQSVTDDLIFTDPHYAIQGIDAFVDMVEEFFARVGDVRLERTSGIDVHHDRARYSWQIVWPDGKIFEGFDASAFDPESQKICRIDGFFGPLPAK